MAVNWASEQAVMMKNEHFIQKAQKLIPSLIRTNEKPVKYYEWKDGVKIPIHGDFGKKSYGKGDRIILDFEHNHAAYFQFVCRSTGSPQDAPAFLHIKFCEIEKEIDEDSANYNGWISKGWIQEEWLHLDELPAEIQMERRYAFRYVVITVLDTSQKFRITLEHAKRQAVSSVKEDNASPFPTEDSMLKQIDRTSVRTLANCMQTVFEDGPKRDRRLWLGDLRLQALADYQTFHDTDLVKRCMYLFAGMPNQEGMIPACVFEKPEPLMDDTFLLDYALFFIPLLVEYYKNTKDRETLGELAPAALHQLEIAMKFVDDNGVVCEEGAECMHGKYYCFIDWNDQLDKQCSMQAVIIYAMRYAEELCRLTGNKDGENECREAGERLSDAARRKFWDHEEHAFISGGDRQVSLASQVWMILADVIRGEEAVRLLNRAEKSPVTMVTPYMHHFYVTALIQCGEKEKALNHIKTYWGGMIFAGADTFWELYNPENEKESPYGSDCVNSYCHAWSCTPAYLLREYYS